jgi:hypothetical protein
MSDDKTDLGLDEHEELKTGTASDEALSAASDAGQDVTSAEKSSLETPDDDTPDGETPDHKIA